MSGLPCDVCMEETIVTKGVPSQDATEELVYRRWRVCINPRCDKYLHRRLAVEYYPEEQAEPKIYEETELKHLMRAMGLQRRNDSEESPMLPWGDLDENDKAS